MDLPCQWGPGGRGARAAGTLDTRPLTRLGGAQLTCLDLSLPIAIFQRKGKILRESHKKTLSVRLTDRLKLRVSPISSGTLLQPLQSCSLQRLLPPPGILPTQSIILNLAAASALLDHSSAQELCRDPSSSAALLATRQPAPHAHRLGHPSGQSKTYPLRSPQIHSSPQAKAEQRAISLEQQLSPFDLICFNIANSRLASPPFLPSVPRQQVALLNSGCQDITVLGRALSWHRGQPPLELAG